MRWRVWILGSGTTPPWRDTDAARDLASDHAAAADVAVVESDAGHTVLFSLSRVRPLEVEAHGDPEAMRALGVGSLTEAAA